MPATYADVANPRAPFGYIIMENDTTFKEVTDLDVHKDGYLFFVRFNTILQSLDCTNRNRRHYKGDAIEQSIQTDDVKELQSNNKLQSEMGHPINGTAERIATIDETRTCNIIKKMWRDGNLIRGSIETLDDGMYGTKLTKMILQGINPSYSYRGFAVLDKRGNITYVVLPPHFITYDEVVLPSHPEAYAEPKKTKVTKSYMTGNEQLFEAATMPKDNYIMEAEISVKSGVVDFSRPIMEADIKELILKDSDNAKSVCESFGIVPSTLALYGNHSLSVNTGDGDTFVFQTERNVARKYADLWKKF